MFLIIIMVNNVSKCTPNIVNYALRITILHTYGVQNQKNKISLEEIVILQDSIDSSQEAIRYTLIFHPAKVSC